MTNKTKAILAGIGGVIVIGGVGVAISDSTPAEIYSAEEFCLKIASDEDYAQSNKNHKYEITGIADKISESDGELILKECVVDKSKYIISCKFPSYDKNKLEDLKSGYIVTIQGRLGQCSSDFINLDRCKLILAEITSETVTYATSSALTEKTEEKTTKSESVETSAETKEKSFLDKMLQIKTQKVKNDKTGNWRYSAYSEKDVDILDYAVEYYKNYFSSNKEIHAVINFANKTTARLQTYDGKYLFITILEYVDGEEHDAAIMFSGNVLKEYMIDMDTRKIDSLKEEVDKTAQETEATTVPEALATTQATTAQTTAVQTAPPTSTAERENHFTDYDNSEQQNTVEYVLNTKTMRIHYPTCNDVKKIKSENYATTTDFDGALKQGYKACGHCNPF